MMDPLEVNDFLYEGDPVSAGDDKVDFEGILDSAELDRMLNDGGVSGSFGLNDADLDKIMNQNNDDDLSLGAGSAGSLDGLSSMPIVEVDDEQVEGLLRNIAQQEDMIVPNAPTSQNHIMMQRQHMMMQEAHPDPLLGSFSNNRIANRGIGTMQRQRQQQQQQQQQHQAFGMQAMAQQVDALQRMVDHAVMQSVPTPHNNMSMPSGTMNHQQGGLDLEAEKMKLLSRLSEINQRQSMANSGMQSRGGNNSGNRYMQSGAMHQMGGMMGQQSRPAAVASVGNMGGSGETPLTSFLRKSQKAPHPSAANAGRSMLSANVPGAPNAANVFSESPMNFDNPMLGGGRKVNNQLFGAMDRTTASQDMVRKLSARSLLARSDSAGHHMRAGLVSQNFRSSGGNATWGDSPAPSSTSFKTSGILPKHVSDNHLLRAANRGGLVKSRSKQGMSRENLRYTKMSSMGSRNPSEDSLGTLPIKRRQAVGSKHKMGLSRSSPYLANPGSAGGIQMNAMW